MTEKSAKRNKPQNLHPVKDLGEADTVLAEIAALKRRIEEINGSLNDTIDQLKDEAAAEVAPLAARLDRLENGLLAYAEYNKGSLFDGRRSVELTFGMLGYRRSSEVAPKPRHTMAMVLGRLEEMGWTAAIRTVRQVNKEELRTWTDERLDLVGARRVEKDTFWYETNTTEIAMTGYDDEAA